MRIHPGDAALLLTCHLVSLVERQTLVSRMLLISTPSWRTTLPPSLVTIKWRIDH